MKVILTAAVALLLLIGAATASADSSTTTFEAPTFSTGTVNTQDGWKSAARRLRLTGYDQKVVTNGASVPDVFGDQSLRISNAYTNGEFHYQTYSKPVQACR